MSAPEPPTDTPRPHHLDWQAILTWRPALGWWRALAWPPMRAVGGQARQRLTRWWHAGPWHKVALLALLPVLVVCVCCSGSFVFALTPYGQRLAAQEQATEAAQATAQARAAATASRYALLHPAPTKPPVPTRTTATARPTPTPIAAVTSQAPFPVCNAKVTNTPCVQYASVQDAVPGWSRVGAIASASIQTGVVSVREDISNVGDATSLDAIQFQCFNIQQAVWWGLDSTINTNATWTYRKSALTEVTISFTASQLGTAPFASCRLTSARVDAIERAGMWDDGDYRGAWSLYDSTTYK